MITRATVKSNTRDAPRYLSKTSRKFYGMILDNYELEPHHLQLLVMACECLDEKEAARVAVAKDGPSFTDRYGQVREHPMVSMGRQARLQYARLIRDLGLDLENPNDPRPNRITPYGR